jgi:hypothetical protein
MKLFGHGWALAGRGWGASGSSRWLLPKPLISQLQYERRGKNPAFAGKFAQPGKPPDDSGETFGQA